MTARLFGLTLLFALLVLGLVVWWTSQADDSRTGQQVGFDSPSRTDVSRDGLDAGSGGEASLAAPGRSTGAGADGRTTGASPEAELAPSAVDAKGPVEELPLKEPAGTALRGFVIGPDGQAPERASLSLEYEGDKAWAYVRPRASDGAFVCAVDGSGDVEIHAFADGIGRTEAQPYFLPSGATLDVGVLRLRGPGSLGGRVVLLDGSPLAGVHVSASASDENVPGGLRTGGAETGENGEFEITGLSDGLFDLEVTQNGAFSVVDATAARTGADDLLLTVEGLVLHVRCVDESGRVLKMTSLRQAPRPLAGGKRSSIGTFGYGADEPAESMTIFARQRTTYLLEAVTADESVHFAHLDGALPGGVHTVDLLESPPELGGLRLRCATSGLPPQAMVQVASLSRDGVKSVGSVYPNDREPGFRVSEVGGLLPGQYSLRCKLKSGGFAALEDAMPIEFEVKAGDVREIELTSFVGGKIELSVNRANESDKYLRGRVEVRRLGTLEWGTTTFVTTHEGGTNRGPSVEVGGNAGVSLPLKAGSYELRVVADGYLAWESSVVVEAEGTVPVAVELIAEE